MGRPQQVSAAAVLSTPCPSLTTTMPRASTRSPVNAVPRPAQLLVGRRPSPSPSLPTHSRPGSRPPTHPRPRSAKTPTAQHTRGTGIGGSMPPFWSPPSRRPRPASSQSRLALLHDAGSVGTTTAPANGAVIGWCHSPTRRRRGVPSLLYFLFIWHFFAFFRIFSPFSPFFFRYIYTFVH